MRHRGAGRERNSVPRCAAIFLLWLLRILPTGKTAIRSAHTRENSVQFRSRLPRGILRYATIATAGCGLYRLPFGAPVEREFAIAGPGYVDG